MVNFLFHEGDVVRVRDDLDYFLCYGMIDLPGETYADEDNMQFVGSEVTIRECIVARDSDGEPYDCYYEIEESDDTFWTDEMFVLETGHDAVEVSESDLIGVLFDE